MDKKKKRPQSQLFRQLKWWTDFWMWEKQRNQPNSGIDSEGVREIKGTAKVLSWTTGRLTLFTEMKKSVKGANLKENMGSLVLNILRLSLDLQWSEVKVAQSCPTLCDPMDYIVLGILQTRILEWVAIPFSRGSSQIQESNSVLPHCRQILYQLSTREAPDLQWRCWIGSLIDPLEIWSEGRTGAVSMEMIFKTQDWIAPPKTQYISRK